MPKIGVLRAFCLLLLVSLALPLTAAALELTVWRPSEGHPGLILPVREHETPVQAAERYEAGFLKNPTLLQLTARSKFIILNKEERRFSDLGYEDFKNRALIIANMPHDLTGNNERMNAFINPLKQEGVKSYIVPLAADLGLNEAESALFIEMLDNRFPSFVSIGGDDVDREVFGGKNIHSHNVNGVRDHFEAQLLRRKILTVQAKIAGRKDRLLAVCRGAQLAALITGLEVGEDIPLEVSKQIKHGLGSGEGGFDYTNGAEQSHPIGISQTSHSLLYRLLGKVDEFTGNSYHHQFIKFLKTNKTWVNWERSGISPADGITEALEFMDSIILLQFHPEYQAIRSQGKMQEDALRMMKGLAHFLSPGVERCESILQ